MSLRLPFSFVPFLDPWSIIMWETVLNALQSRGAAKNVTRGLKTVYSRINRKAVQGQILVFALADLLPTDFQKVPPTDQLHLQIFAPADLPFPPLTDFSETLIFANSFSLRVFAGLPPRAGLQFFSWLALLASRACRRDADPTKSSTSGSSMSPRRSGSPYSARSSTSTGSARPR